MPICLPPRAARCKSAPTQLLDGFAQRVGEARGAFSGDLLSQLEQARDALLGIVDGLPSDPNAVVSALLDQVLSVLASLDGPEAERIRAWIQSVQELHKILLPLIEQAQAGGDPAAVALAVMQRSLDNALDILGFGPVRKLVDLLDDFPGNALPGDLLGAASTQLDAVMDAYGQSIGLADAGYGAFRDSVAAGATALQTLEQRLRPVNSALRRVAGAPIFQPGALEDFLRERIDHALGVQVVEAQKIDDPMKALFDRIDAAIGEIDLSVVRTETLAFFERVRTTIEAVDVPALGTTLQEQLAPVQQLFQDLQAGVSGLLEQIRAFFEGLAGQVRSLASRVGDFAADGSFHYNFERDLRELLGTARRAIGGDPADPGAPSLSGALDEFRGSIDQFLAQLNGVLQPLGQSIEDARDTAVGGINDFVAFLNGLDIEQLIETLRQQVEGIVQALTPIDFNLVVDPVVEGIDENTAKLRDIDPSSLNDLLREALAAALDVVISIDFTVAISDPLNEQLEQVKQLPTQAIEELQQRYEQALSVLEQLSPQQLLDALFAAFDTINQAVGQLDVAPLLQPLDQLHEQHLVQPLSAIRPSTLIQPLAAAFGELSQVVGGVKGQALLAPLTTQLDQLKAVIANFDISGWIDELLAAVESTKQRLRAMRPSLALQALTADFARLESALDQFKPSVIFQPAAELAAPLLQLLETIQQQTVGALFAMFQAPLQLFDRLEPAALTQRLVQQIDTLLAALRAINLPARFNQLKGRHYDLTLAVGAQGMEAKVALAAAINPERALGPLVAAYSQLIEALEGLKQNLRLDGLADIYLALRERVLGLLPPFARELLDVDTFKRLMRLADPTRFLQELDQRFTALKDRLIPIRPQDIAAELDATYDVLLAQVEELDIAGALNQVKITLEGIKDIAATVRVDFLAGDIDRAVADLRALVEGLNPAALAGELDDLHAEVVEVVASTKPSTLLGGLQATLDEVKGIVASVDPRAALGQPLNQAWTAVEGLLDAVDFTVILAPLAARIDELAVAFLAALRRVEEAFDQMLGAARTALSGSGAGASVGVGI